MTTAIVKIQSPTHLYPGHSENPGRFSSLGDLDSKPYAPELLWLDSHPADQARVATVHSPGMIAEVEKAYLQAPAIIDYAPTYVTHSSARDAYKAVGGVLACTQSVIDRKARNAFAIIRPPGHHAEPDGPMGFCIFNNVAIATRAALEQGFRQVMIVDFDAHHGNGTQAAFWQEKRVAYFSTHQENIYPGSGGLEEAPHARGRIVNLPLPAYSGDQTFALLTRKVLIPLIQQRQPEIIFVSAGFDSHWDDPITSLGLSSMGFYDLARSLVEQAEMHCNGRIVFALEGGYNPLKVASGLDACLRALTGTEPDREDPDLSPYPEEDIQVRLSRLMAWHDLS
jgi:acetoin utilization deacetylase AcuC-like enzyme